MKNNAFHTRSSSVRIFCSNFFDFRLSKSYCFEFYFLVELFGVVDSSSVDKNGVLHVLDDVFGCFPKLLEGF